MNPTNFRSVLRSARQVVLTPAQWRKGLTIRGPLHDRIFTLIEAVAYAALLHNPHSTYNACQELRNLMVEIAGSNPRMRELTARTYSPPTSTIPVHGDDVSLVSINDSPFTTHSDILYILDTCIAHLTAPREVPT